MEAVPRSRSRNAIIGNAGVLVGLCGAVLLIALTSGCGSSNNSNSKTSSNSSPTPTATPTAVPLSGAAVLVVPNASGNSVDAFSLSQLAAGGNVAPEVDISGSNTQLNTPYGACFDGSGNLWVVNLVGSKQASSITEFLAGDASGGGNLTPSVTISGGNTGLVASAQCKFDSSGDLWVVNDDGNSISAFTPSQLVTGGNITPTVTISGSNTDLCNPPGLTFDNSGNAWVTGLCFNNIVEFKASDLASSGNTAFTVEIEGSNTQLNQPFGLVFDQSGNLWVANSAGNGGTPGVLEFKASDLATGGNVAPAVTISGSNTQMNAPYGVAFDPSGNLWVSQGSNALTGYSAADLAAGGDIAPFSVVSGSNTKLNRPVYLLFHALATDLAVPDYSDNRVLLYKQPFTNGETAHKVIGQADFTSTASGLTQSTLHSPVAVATDPSGNGWVADVNNCRVLEFTPPFSNGMNATVVLGQSDFTTENCVASATTLSAPFGVAADKNGDIWVADDGNCRVVEFKPPFSNGMAASLVLGEPDLTTTTCSPGQSTMTSPDRLTFDQSGNLWVSDANDNRVLEFSPPFSDGMNATLVLGQSDFTSSGAATTATGLSNPLGVAFDASGNLWVSDHDNCRVVEYKPPFSNGMAASLAIGEPDLATANCASGTADALGYAGGVALDALGNLFVSDMGNARVLEFSPPFSSGMSASTVFGQTDFAGSSCDQGGSAGASTLCVPEGLTIGNTP